MRPGLLDGVRRHLPHRHAWTEVDYFDPVLSPFKSSILEANPHLTNIRWTVERCRICDKKRIGSMRTHFTEKAP